jgi:hypothetical protein
MRRCLQIVLLLLTTVLVSGCVLAPEHEPELVPASPPCETVLRAPQSTGVVLDVEQVAEGVTVGVTAGFTRLSEREQYLATAQLVWPATDVCCATQLLVRLGEQPLSVLTDSGPVQRPVGRDDYRAVAPR